MINDRVKQVLTNDTTGSAALQEGGKRSFIYAEAEYYLQPNTVGWHCAWANHYLQLVICRLRGGLLAKERKTKLRRLITNFISCIHTETYSLKSYVVRDRSWFIAWGGGGGGDFWENKRGIAENSGRIQRGTTQICLQNEDRGGVVKVIKSY